MTRRTASLLVIALVAIAGAAIAAVGSQPASAGAEARAKGAVAVPADALAYASIAADREGAQWQALEALAAKVPGGADAVASLDERMAGEDAGVLNALGGDVSLGLLGVDIAGGATPTADAVLVATAADGTALARELAAMDFAEGPALDGTPVWEKDAFAIAIDGSTVIGATSRATLREALEVRAGDAPALADDAAFRATVGKLPDDPLLFAYLSPARIAPLAQAAAALLPAQGQGPDATAGLAQLAAALGDVRGLGIAVRAEEGGLRIAAAGDADQAALEAAGARFPTAFTPGLVEQVPADAAGFAVFKDAGPALLAAVRQLEQASPQMREYVASLEQGIGISLEDDLVPALSGQHALVGLAGDEPKGALLLAPADPVAAGSTMAKALDFGREMLGDRAEKAKDVAVTRQADSPIIAIGNAPQLAARPDASIASTAAYQAIVGAAGVPGTVTGLAYLDAAPLRAKAATKAAAEGKRLPAAADAVRGVVAWGTPTGAQAFIAIG